MTDLEINKAFFRAFKPEDTDSRKYLSLKQITLEYETHDAFDEQFVLVKRPTSFVNLELVWVFDELMPISRHDDGSLKDGGWIRCESSIKKQLKTAELSEILKPPME